VALASEQRCNTADTCVSWHRSRDLFRGVGSPNAANFEGGMRDAGCDGV
jgi:hypothetical protein